MMLSPYDFMLHAMLLSERARFHSPPNPWVGCIIVKDHQIAGEGYTQRPGQAHAEICALQQAKGLAKGAALYTTLEPCAHTGKTPPCTEAIIQAGIKEVYIGIEDPDSRVKGKGIQLLQAAGIQVHLGLAEKEIKQSLASYLYHRETGLPYTILKSAISLDGRTAACDGTSQWITCLEARQDVHFQRALSQAIVIGAGTAMKDRPQLTVRHPDFKSITPPLRVILDAKGSVEARGPLFDQTTAPTLIVTTSNCPESRLKEWESAGVEIAFVAASEKGVDLLETWQLLGSRSILQVLVEGGSRLHTSLLETSLVNRLLIYMGSLLIGSSGHPFYQKNSASLNQAQSLDLKEIKRLGSSVRLEYEFL